MRPRRLLLLTLTCAGFALPFGCGGSDDSEETALDGSWGSLFSATDVVSDDPRLVVARYLGFLRAGASARALAQYEPAVRDAVGLRRLARALEQVGIHRALGRTDVEVTDTGPTATRVLVTLRSGEAEPVPYDFTLVDRRGGWRIAYDELTTLDSFATWAAIQSGGTATERGAAAARQAQEAFLDARALALRPPDRP